MTVRVTVAAWIGSPNAGDELIHAALREKLLTRSVDLTAVTVDPDAARSRGTTAVGHVAPVGVARAIRAGDALIVGGGGLLQDQTSVFNLPLHLSRPGWARVVGTPFAAVGLGAGPLHTRAGRALVRHGFRGAVAVGVRDHASARILRTLGIRAVRVTADLAVSLPSPVAAPDDWIAACLRPWRAGRDHLPVTTRATRDITPDHMIVGLARGLDDAARRLGLPTRLVAMQRGWDDLVHRRVAARMHTPVTMVGPSPDAVVEVLAASRVVVAMRYHAAIAALLAARPAALIAYDPKLVALAADIGTGVTVLPWTPHGLDQLGRAVAAVARHDTRPPATLARLRARERINDEILDILLERATVPA